MPNPLVLLIEDDPRLFDTISDLLELLNIDCMVASGGMTPSVNLVGMKPDLVILDLPLRSRGALDVLTDIYLDLRLRHIKLVLIAADEYADASAFRYADAVLMKPFAVGELENTLCRLLGHQRIAELTRAAQT